MKDTKQQSCTYWKKVIKEAGMNIGDIEHLTKDRKIWKIRAEERMEHIDIWETDKTIKEQREVSACIVS